MHIQAFTYLLLLFPIASWASNTMPCEYIKDELTIDLSYYSEKQTPEFLKCISTFRVCAVADGDVVYTKSIKDIKSSQEATTLVILQSPPDVSIPLCLVGSYSGGSSAAWSFKAYKIINGAAIAYSGMHKAYAQGDAVPPKDAAIATYKMFEKYAEK